MRLWVGSDRDKYGCQYCLLYFWDVENVAMYIRSATLYAGSSKTELRLPVDCCIWVSVMEPRLPYRSYVLSQNVSTHRKPGEGEELQRASKEITNQIALSCPFSVVCEELKWSFGVCNLRL